MIPIAMALISWGAGDDADMKWTTQEREELKQT